MILILIANACSWVFISDISGFSNTVRRFFSTLRKPTPQLLICSLCQSWWSGLLYIIITGKLSFVNVALVLAIACSTSIIKGLFDLVFDALNAVIMHLEKKIDLWNERM